MTTDQQLTLSRALAAYLLTLETARRSVVWRELSEFVRWYGGERSVRDLAPEEVRRYREQLTAGDSAPHRLELLRGFLTYLERTLLVSQPLAAALSASEAASGILDAGRQPQAPAEKPPPETEPRCPSCGEEDALRGKRRVDHIAITCERCGHAWRRSLDRSCPRCGATDMVASSQAVVERVRGNQTAIVGAVPVYRCRRCDG